MADVFISYAREDREQANKLAQALGQLGWSVWWDRKIVTGQVFDQAIERELETARSAVVLWSRHSIDSEWVKNEAAAAAERGLLVPATVENVRLPLEFRRKQTADLSDWHGEGSHAGFQALCEGLAAVMGDAPTRRELPQKGKGRLWVLAAVAALAILAGLGLYRLKPQRAAHAVNADPAIRGLADLAVGSYSGDIVAAVHGGSRSDVLVTVSRLDRSMVHVTSEDERLGAFDVTLTRPIENHILGAAGDPVFHLYLDQSPPKLELSVHSEVSYSGTKQ